MIEGMRIVAKDLAGSATKDNFVNCFGFHRKVKMKKQIIEEPYQTPTQSRSGQKSYKELVKESKTERHKKK